MGEHAVLISASASPLCILHRTDGERYIFYGDREPHFRIEGDPGKKELILSLIHIWLLMVFVWREALSGSELLCICRALEVKQNELMGLLDSGSQGKKITEDDRNRGYEWQ